MMDQRAKVGFNWKNAALGYIWERAILKRNQTKKQVNMVLTVAFWLSKIYIIHVALLRTEKIVSFTR